MLRPILFCCSCVQAASRQAAPTVKIKPIRGVFFDMASSLFEWLDDLKESQLRWRKAS
jgi:hypothetical protein